MRKSLKLPFAVVCLLSILQHEVYSQELESAKYDWDKNPRIHTLSSKEQKEDEMILLEKRMIEFSYAPDGTVNEHLLIHKIKRVNSDKSIQQNNQIYLPSENGVRFLKNKVRVITPLGKVKELSEKDIREGVDEESQMKFRFYAIEGLEIGSEIEYFYFQQVNPNVNGDREIVQDKIPKKNFEFTFIAPSNLEFKFKSYNGLPPVTQDTSATEHRIYRLAIPYVEGLEKEELSTYIANLQQFIFKLYSNTATGVKDIGSYGSVSQYVYETFIKPAEKGDLKKVKKLSESVNTKYCRDEEDKIRTVENFIQTQFVTVRNNPQVTSDLSEVISKKAGTEAGILKLYSQILNHLNIDYQLVLTSNRNDLKFDKDFEAFNFLGSYLIYFPSIDKYLCPSNNGSCLGFIPSEFTNNYGLFIKKLSLNGYATGIGKIKFIDAVKYDKNFSNHFVKVHFAGEITNPSIEAEIQMGGYYAAYLQPYYSYLSPEDQKKLTDQLLNQFLEDTDIKNLKVENGEREYLGVKPFIIKTTLIGNDLVESAGNNYIFKIGELIGKQVEMYQESQRKMEVENNYNRLYERVITVDIPKGYKISNMKNLNMDISYPAIGDKSLSFVSSYTLDQDKLIVNIKEYYAQMTIPVKEYENFRKVVNAAADFNKISIILEKI